MTSYITYAKHKVHPKLTDAAVRNLVDGYVEMRSVGSNRRIITATLRQLESLIRLSEAHAKIRLVSFVLCPGADR